MLYSSLDDLLLPLSWSIMFALLKLHVLMVAAPIVCCVRPFVCFCLCLCFCFCFVFVLTYSYCSCWWWRPQLLAVLGLGGTSWPPGWWQLVDLALINPEKDRVCLNNTAPGQMFGQAEQTIGKQPMSFLGWGQSLNQFWVCCHFKNMVAILPY